MVKSIQPGRLASAQGHPFDLCVCVCVCDRMHINVLSINIVSHSKISKGLYGMLFKIVTLDTAFEY